ncbi:MAG: SDR family NAD(P)-dependent oxidoreductase, partial [Gemmatimonadetes bacterium]|nr:SDR family NAD(P)-dependent oxidoreductase [Gemmatimonadota bacterium]
MSTFNPAGSVALVTGANRGIGRAFVKILLDRGSAKIYAGARSTDSFDDLRALDPERVIPVQIDVTDAGQIAAVAAQAGDIDLLINN